MGLFIYFPFFFPKSGTKDADGFVSISKSNCAYFVADFADAKVASFFCVAVFNVFVYYSAWIKEDFLSSMERNLMLVNVGCVFGVVPFEISNHTFVW